MAKVVRRKNIGLFVRVQICVYICVPVYANGNRNRGEITVRSFP